MPLPDGRTAPAVAETAATALQHLLITEPEFRQFQHMIFTIAGISLSDEKKALVSGRLAKRLKHHALDSYGAYFRFISDPRNHAELKVAVDLLTTNETYFFREPRHFEFLRDEILNQPLLARPFRVWSAAASSGEEAYTLAMVLADRLGEAGSWEVLGTDISSRMLEKARAALYPLDRARYIPPALLTRYCLKGIGPQAGTLLVDRRLQAKVRFLEANLNAALPDLGQFDVIFLRNVMIYFNLETKRQVVARVCAALKPGGWFMVGHSESLNGIAGGLKMVLPSVYRKI